MRRRPPRSPPPALAARRKSPRALRRDWPWRGIAPCAAPRRSETEVVSELQYHRVEVRHLHVAWLIADQRAGRRLAGLMIQLEARAPFVAGRGVASVLHAHGVRVEIGEAR